MKTKFNIIQTLLIGTLITANSLYSQAQTTEFWGMTPTGGNAGTIFKTDENGLNHSVENIFGTIDGAEPNFNNLLETSNGKLYGTTTKGGSSNKGVIFEYNISSNTQTKLYDFDNTNGSYPSTSLIEASNGKLYGMTRFGGSLGYGVIFKFDISTNTQTKLHDFDYTNGSTPYGVLSETSNGVFHGVTRSGGTSDLGVIFKYETSSNTLTKLYDFDNISGDYPTGSLMLASNGKMYGLTSSGGTSNIGVIFDYDILNNIHNKLYDFNNKGEIPYGNLMEASNGKLYGMTHLGGTQNRGVIFEYDILNNNQTKLYDFDNINGNTPYGYLIEASNGKLYGMTPSGGSLDNGVIFEYNISSNTQTKLFDFDNINGKTPIGNLMEASNGKLYGMTSSGGSSNNGIIFEYDILTNTQTKLYDFDNTNGRAPTASLIEASNGKLYGMTEGGGTTGYGVIFEYDIASNTQTKLYNFDNTTGGFPKGSLMEASNGKLYGMASIGGSSNDGIIFEYNILTISKTTLYEFDRTNGGGPKGDLMEASNGKLYGTTQYTLTAPGSIIEYDIITGALSKTFDFGGLNGVNPVGSLIEVIVCQPTTGTDVQTACNTFDWIDGSTYTSDNNTATFTLTSSAGCDSLVTLDLTINSVDTIVTQSGVTLTASASSATYQWLDCNNNLSQINGETAQTFTATSNGSYAVRVIANGCTDTSYCYTVMSTNITENDFGDELIIYPNPTNGNFAIDMGKTYRNIAVTITDLTGKILYQKNYNNTQQIQISITEPTGIYVLSIESENKKSVIRLIKE